MIWFKQFINETVDLWSAQKGGYTVFKENPRIASFLEEHDLTSIELGNMGENYVKQLLKDKGYTAYRTERSRTPADVWSIHIEDGLVHIPIIQVKATGENDNLKDLNTSQKTDLLNLSGFIYEQYYKSVIVSDKYKEKYGLIISTGYAGVVFDDNLEPTVEVSYYNGCAHSDDIDYKNVEKLLKLFHKL